MKKIAKIEAGTTQIGMGSLSKMSEKTALELNDLFRKTTAKVDVYGFIFGEMINSALEKAEIQSTLKTVDYELSSLKASFITRWYWNKRLRKERAKLVLIQKQIAKYKSL